MKMLPSDFLLATTLRSIGDGVISCDSDGSVVLMNGVAQELTGWSEEEALGRNLKEVFVIVNETTRELVEDPADKVLRLGRIVGMANHTVLIRRDGSEVFIDDSAAPVHDGDGGLRGVVLVFRDMTKRRRAEWNMEMLSASGKALGEARIPETILAEVGSVVSRHFADFCIFDLVEGDQLKRVVGRHRIPELQPFAEVASSIRPPANAALHPIRRVLATKQSRLLVEPSEQVFEQMAADEVHLEYLQQLHPKSILVVPLLAGEVLIGAATFVRHRMKETYDDLDVVAAEELGTRVGLALCYARLRDELRLQRARLDAMLAAAPVGVMLAERSGKIIMANEEVQRIFRPEIHYSKDAASHAEYVSFHPDGRQVKGEEYPLPRAMAEDRVIRDERFLYARGDGSQAWISCSAAPIKDSQGQVWGGVVAIADIDQLVRAEELAERSRKRVQTMMERASVGIAVGDFDGGLSYANDTLLKMIGYTKEEVEHGEVRWDAMTPPEYLDRDLNALRELHQDCYANPYEKAYIAKDGHLVPMLIGATCIPSLDLQQKKDDIAVFYTDLTAQKRAEAALLQTEKLTAVGRLASSISHEINNPLEAVTNLLFIVRNSPNLSRSDRDYLESADRELARVSQITAQTLRFHRQTTAATEVRPEDLYEEVLALYSTRLAASSIEIMREYQDDVRFTCFEGDIRQVLSNLIGNAFDSMRQGGVLRLRTRYATRWATSQQGVMLTIADNGTGMTGEVKSRIFDAFYSTKGIHGTGLGLWICRRIIHKHRGRLQVCSSTGERHGSIFQLWLPVTLAPSAKEPWHSDIDGIR